MAILIGAMEVKTQKLVPTMVTLFRWNCYFVVHVVKGTWSPTWPNMAQHGHYLEASGIVSHLSWIMK